MDPNNAVGYRHRRSPSSDRFIGVFSRSTDGAANFTSSAGDELDEIDVFYNSDFSSGSESRIGRLGAVDHRFRLPEKFGILAALPERDWKNDVIVEKPVVSARDIPAIPKPHSSMEAKLTQSMPGRRFQQSAPVNVPRMAMKARKEEVEEADDEEVLPPHEMAARVSLRNQKTTFSVLEGVGRTLKGRDLRQVRNAVWRQTGFLD